MDLPPATSGSDVFARRHGTRLRVLIVIGTRPEAVKMAPVIRALSARGEHVTCRVCVTGQHRELLDQMLGHFTIAPDHDLDIMTPGQSPDDVAARVRTRLAPVLRQERPDWVLVQGDTTTAVAAAFAARRQGLNVGHVEAGLRSFNLRAPFPEEWNRVRVAQLATMHFAPTPQARGNLMAEGVPAASIRVTGNTGIDALLQTVAVSDASPQVSPWHGQDERPFLILVTAHRSENFGQPMDDICRALRTIADRYRDRVRIVFPVHPRPEVARTARARLDGTPSVDLVDPLDYPSLVRLLTRADLVLSDSGGLQEEAPALGKPLLVLRDVTERPEGVAVGAARLVGTDCDRIVDETTRLMHDAAAYGSMAERRFPYGDGRAADRIASALLERVITKTTVDRETALDRA